MSRGFHVTTAANLQSILATGLEPRIGGRSLEMGESVPAVYLFATMEAVDTALMNWLGESFDEDESLCIIELDHASIPTEPAPGKFEMVVPTPLPASAIVRVKDESGHTLFRRPLTSDDIRTRLAASGQPSLKQLTAMFADYDGPEVSGAMPKTRKPSAAT